MLYKSNLLTLKTIGYSWYIVMSIVYGPKWPFYSCWKSYWIVWDRYMQVLYLGRALRTKEALPDFLKWCRVIRHSLIFGGLTGSQRTPGKWGVTNLVSQELNLNARFRFHLFNPQTTSPLQYYYADFVS